MPMIRQLVSVNNSAHLVRFRNLVEVDCAILKLDAISWADRWIPFFQERLRKVGNHARITPHSPGNSTCPMT